MDYRETIKKLLKLAESPSQGEAEAAMTKARALMVKYKIEESDLTSPEKCEVVIRSANLLYSTRKNFWRRLLAAVIAKHNCCFICADQIAPNSLTRDISFVGESRDVDVCLELFQYAVEYVNAQIAKYEKAYKRKLLTAKEKRKAVESFGLGFANGLKEAFEVQNAQLEQEYGLVPVMNSQVSSFFQRCRKITQTINYDFSQQAFDAGKEQGRTYQHARRLATTQ